MKKLNITLVLFFTFLGSAWAEAQTPSFKDVLQCQKTLVSSIQGLYFPEDGYFLCDEPTTACYLAYENGDSYKIEIPQHPTYAVREVFLEMTDQRQKIEHRLMSWNEPKSAQKAYVDIFWGENKRGFGRSLEEANTTKFSDSKPMKSESKVVREIATKSLETQMGLIENNLTRKSFPPGWDIEKYKKAAQKRLAGCGWNKKAQEILKLAKDSDEVEMQAR